MQTIINCKTFYKTVIGWLVSIFDSCQTEFKLKANEKHILTVQVTTWPFQILSTTSDVRVSLSNNERKSRTPQMKDKPCLLHITCMWTNVCVFSVNLSLSLSLEKQISFAFVPKYNVDVYNTMLPPIGYNGCTHALSSLNVTCKVIRDLQTVSR